MNIALLGVFPPFRGGIQHFNTLLYHHLKTDHDVSVINFLHQYPNVLFPGTSQFDSAAPSDPAFRERLLDPINPVTWLKVAQRLKYLGPDLVIFKYWMPYFAPSLGTVMRRLRANTTARSLCIIDNLMPHERRVGDRSLNRYLVANTDLFICMSETVETELLELKPAAVYRRKSHPLYDNFGARLDKETARRRLGLGDEPLLLYFGYIRKYKGVLTLLDAMPMIVQQLGAKCIIAGEFYDDREPYLAKIDTLDLEPHLILADRFIPDDEVNLYFSAADVVVLPYLSATQSGIVSIALNYELPCIVTAVGGLPEIIHHQETGLLVPPDNPQALAEAVVSYFKEADQTAMARFISREKQRYSWEAFTETIIDLATAPPHG
ncbi:MAG: glycosyltransferase family 4 protein [Fidelibacterota bacterium]|nr:MAG: glycosyltransferase family 4 protein [Candidatus Neomarinimicrobiota bacterium]